MQKSTMFVAMVLLMGTLYADSSVSPQVLANAIVQEADSQRFNPIGVVGYGLIGNLNGSNFTTYQIDTNSIYGCVNISSMHAYVPNSLHEAPPYETGMQLNTYLIINATNGATYAYWLQNVALFNTTAMRLDIGNQIYNVTSYSHGKTGDLSFNTLSGNGVIVYNSSETRYTNVDILLGDKNRYVLPFTYCPITAVSMNNGNPSINFDYASNGSLINFDTVTFHIESERAYLLVTPYRLTPQGAHYDAEFVFGGGGNGENVTFSSLSASDMWLFYDSGGTMIPFPSVYTFGTSTIEGTDNLQVNPSNDYASIGIGKPNLFDNILLTGPGNKTGVYSGSMPNSTTSYTTLPTTTRQSEPSGSGLSLVEATLIAAILAVLALFLLWLVRRGKKAHKQR